MELIYKVIKKGFKVYDFRVFSQFNWGTDIFLINDKFYSLIKDKLSIVKNKNTLFELNKKLKSDKS